MRQEGEVHIKTVVLHVRSIKQKVKKGILKNILYQNMYIQSNIPYTLADKQRILCVKIHPQNWI